MAPDNVKWFALLGFALIAVGGFAAYFMLQAIKSKRVGTGWLAAEICFTIAGAKLGFTLSGLTTQFSPTTKTVGFPFLSGVLELHDGRWSDYVGPLTLPAAVGNFSIGVLTPQLILGFVLWAYLRRRHNEA